MEYLVRGDTAATIKVTLTRHDTGAVVVLTDDTVVLKVRKKNTATVLFTLIGTEITVGDFDLGVVNFSFSTNLDALEGYYEGEIEVTYASAQIESVFELISFQVRADF